MAGLLFAHLFEPAEACLYCMAQKGVRTTVRPSGHNINSSFDKIESGGSIPSNVLEDTIANEMLIAGNNSANDPYTMKCKAAGIKIHPARFPYALPEFFIKLLTDEGDIVLDPFAGSNTTGAVAEKLGMRWISIELLEEYLIASKFRFSRAGSPFMKPQAERLILGIQGSLWQRFPIAQ